jgi:phosphate uptake regulator
MFEDFEQVDTAIHALANKVADLGVYTEEMFKNAVSLLFTREWSSISTIFDADPDVSPVTLVSEALHLTHQYFLSSDQSRLVMALQQAANELGEILKIITRIASRTGHLDNDVEVYFHIIGAHGYQSFYRLIHSAYVQLRGCVIVLSSLQPSMATNVIQQDSVLDQAYLETQSAIKAALVADVSLTLPLGNISVIIGEIESLGNHVTRICQRIENLQQLTTAASFSYPDSTVPAAM